MGHLRIGFLPRTRKWSAVVAAIGLASGADDFSVLDIADKTLDASRSALKRLPYDKSIQRCFQFLIGLAMAGREGDVHQAAERLGIHIEGIPTKLQISKALREWLSVDSPSEYDPEIAELSRRATADTIAEWINEHSSSPQLHLFIKDTDPFQPWKVAATGRGFCDLSRIFFSNFANRYLNYFLSRTASAQIGTLPERDAFASAINEQSALIAEHAFETSKIVQSFSAGWFNKHASGEAVPSAQEIQGFLSYAFEKIREEFRREKEAH